MHFAFQIHTVLEEHRHHGLRGFELFRKTAILKPEQLFAHHLQRRAVIVGGRIGQVRVGAMLQQRVGGFDVATEHRHG